MKSQLKLDGFAAAALFALAPAAAAGGALALAVLLCLAGAAAFRPSLVRDALGSKPAALGFIVLFTIWVCLSSLWSPYPAATQALKVAALVLFGSLFVAAAAGDGLRRLTVAAGLASALVLIVLLAVEVIWDFPINRGAQPGGDPSQLIRNFGRGSAFLVILAWPVAGGLIALGGGVRFGAALALLAATAVLAVQLDQLGNGVAFLAGACAFVAAFIAPRLALYAVSGGLAAWVLLAPFVTPLILSNPRLLDALPLSWAARAGIWNYVSARVFEQPWIGHGLEASRAVTDRIYVRELDMRGTPVHPHSASLQIWFETGLVGALLAAAALVFGGRWLVRNFGDDKPAAATACATLAAIGLIANVSFGLWAEWWIATMFMAAALVGAVRRSA